MEPLPVLVVLSQVSSTEISGVTLWSGAALKYLIDLIDLVLRRRQTAVSSRQMVLSVYIDDASSIEDLSVPCRPHVSSHCGTIPTASSTDFNITRIHITIVIMNSSAVKMHAVNASRRVASLPFSRTTRNVKVAAARNVDASSALSAISAMKKTAMATSLSLALSVAAFVPHASAELNQYEAQLGGEFGNGTAQQYGEAEIPGRNFSKQDLRRSNFTAADCRDCNFKDAKLVGAYFIKSVVARANFENADLSDTLMDRAVIVDANLRNAVLQRGVFTRSDFSRSDIYGADFTNALVDKSQQMQMCKIADGVNKVTGVSTRKSLNCSSRRQFAASTPSNPEGPQVSDAEKSAFTASMPSYRE